MSCGTVFNLRQSGALQTVIVAGMPRITVQSYRAYVARQRRQSSVR